MFGKTVQHEYEDFCLRAGHRPYQDMQDLIQQHVPLATILRRAGVDSAVPAGLACAARAKCHLKALVYEPETAFVPLAIDDSLIQRLCASIESEEQPVVHDFIEFTREYVQSDKTPADFLRSHDPTLRRAGGERTAAAIVSSAVTLFADPQVPWEIACKYYQLARCYDVANSYHNCIDSWAASGRAVDVSLAWQHFVDQHLWRQTADTPMPHVQNLIQTADYEPSSLQEWANTVLPELIYESAKEEQSYQVADLLLAVVERDVEWTQTAGRRMAEAALLEARTQRVCLQTLVGPLPHSRGVIRETLNDGDDWVKGHAVRWLTVSPDPGLVDELRENYHSCEDSLLQSRLGQALAAALQPEPHASTQSLTCELAEISKLTRPPARQHAARRGHRGKAPGQRWLDPQNMEAFFVPRWLHEVQPPAVRWARQYQPTRGEYVSPDVLRGAMLGAVGYRFQNGAAELDMLAGECDVGDWYALCDWVLTLFRHVLRAAIREAGESSDRLRMPSRLRTLIHQPGPKQLSGTTARDMFAVRGLIEFAYHGEPTSTALRIWQLLDCRLFDDCGEFDVVAADVLRVLDHRRDADSLTVLYDLDWQWYFSTEEYWHCRGKEDIARDAGLTVQGLRWQAIPQMPGIDVGAYCWFDGHTWQTLGVDAGFRIRQHGSQPHAGVGYSRKTSQWVVPITIDCLQQYIDRAAVRLRTLFRDLACEPAGLTPEQWTAKCLATPLARIGARRTVWLGTTNTDRTFFVVGEGGELRNIRGHELSQNFDAIHVASCVNATAEEVLAWQAYFRSRGVVDFCGQFDFAACPGAVIVDGFWTIPDLDWASWQGRVVTAKHLDSWAFHHGYRSEGDDDYVCLYLRDVASGVRIELEVEGFRMPTESGESTELLEVAFQDPANRQDCLAHDRLLVIRQQVYADMSALCGSDVFSSPPGIRCL